MAAIQGQLTRLGDRIHSAARRSRRFSWFSWGFVFATAGGYLLSVVLGLLYPMVTTTVTNYGTQTTTTFPWWSYPVGFAPAIVVLALAVREALVGRREAVEHPALSESEKNVASPGEATAWTEMVQQSQKLVTHMKNETEISFLPLFLGGLSIAEVVAAGTLGSLIGTGGGVWIILLDPLIGLPFLLLLLPLYFVTRNWIRSYQMLLDRQVGELSRLESDFFTRFAGVAPSG